MNTNIELNNSKLVITVELPDDINANDVRRFLDETIVETFRQADIQTKTMKKAEKAAERAKAKEAKKTERVESNRVKAETKAAKAEQRALDKAAKAEKKAKAKSEKLLKKQIKDLPALQEG